jgi:hypothetical protein
MKQVRIFLAVVALAIAVLPKASVAQEIREERVNFKPGASSASVSGSIHGRETVDYVLGAKAGQTMTVTLKTGNTSTYFNVLPPGSEAALFIGSTSGNDWTGTLPVDGDYRVRVYMMRNAARRNEAASYTLSVGITGAPASHAQERPGDAKVAGTPYHATGMIPCSVGTDPKGSAQCSFGVIRGASGNAEVHIAPVGYDVVAHRDTVETVLMFSGDTVTSRDPDKTVSAAKHGDDWSIGVNDFYFYTIPDAVIVGG